MFRLDKRRGCLLDVLCFLLQFYASWFIDTVLALSKSTAFFTALSSSARSKYTHRKKQRNDAVLTTLASPPTSCVYACFYGYFSPFSRAVFMRKGQAAVPKSQYIRGQGAEWAHTLHNTNKLREQGQHLKATLETHTRSIVSLLSFNGMFYTLQRRCANCIRSSKLEYTPPHQRGVLMSTSVKFTREKNCDRETLRTCLSRA